MDDIGINPEEDPPAFARRESAWDYPRPPRVENTSRHIQVYFNHVLIADTVRARRVLETSHAPAYYIPHQDIRLDCLRPSIRTTFCEFKGRASYYDVVVGDLVVRNAAWYYPDPSPGFELIRDYVAFYPSRVHACLVDGELARSQDGDYYGGWITSDVVGPFKGGPGTLDW